MVHSSWTSVCEFLRAEQKSSMHILESKDQDHADGYVEHLGIDASEAAIGDDRNVICSHSVAQVAIHSQVVSQGTGVVNVPIG
jgi:ribulose bisphosphate carboxylase small subunit